MAARPISHACLHREILGQWSHLVQCTHLCDEEQAEGKVNGWIPPVCCKLKVKAVFIQPFQFFYLIPSEIAEEVVNGFLLSKLHTQRTKEEHRSKIHTDLSGPVVQTSNCQSVTGVVMSFGQEASESWDPQC